MSLKNVVPTVHNEAEFGEIAEDILLPGDPLRAKYVAENYLSDVKCYNKVRNMLGYTGTYKGKRVSVQGTGMGMPTMYIYSYELIHFYKAKRLMRVGTCGTHADNVELNDIVLGMGACHDSNIDEQYQLPGKYAPICSFDLLEKVVQTARKQELKFHVGNIASGSTFYSEERTDKKSWKDMGILAYEMEAAALYMNAASAGVEALTVLQVTDQRRTGEIASREQREKGVDDLIELALESLLIN